MKKPEPPKPPEYRVQCGYCFRTMLESEYNVHFCVRHEKLMKALPYMFAGLVFVCTAAGLFGALWRQYHGC